MEQLSGRVFNLYEMVPGFAVSTLAILLVSASDRTPSAEEVATFNTVRRQVTARQRILSGRHNPIWDDNSRLLPNLKHA